MTADLEGYERAFRLRASADDGLLRQIFGDEDALKELSRTNPSLLETARTYFPHLTSSTYDRLVREPDALQVEKDRCAREMEQLAVQNYGAFIGNAKVTDAVYQELSDIQKTLDNMDEMLSPIQDQLKDFKTTAADLSTRRSSLRNVLHQHGTLLELLELPQLLDACIRNQMYDESLELLAYCSNMLQPHEASGEEIPVLATLREQVTVQRSNLHAALVAQLKTDIHLPQCVRVIGFLRRIQRHSEEEFRSLFIEHRSAFLDSHKQQVEMLRNNRSSVVTALRNAADLLRTHVYDIGTQYRALFHQDDGPLCAWLNQQILWLTGLLRAHLLPPRGDAATGPAGRGVGGSSAAGGARIDAAALTTVLRQCLHASSTLKRLGGHFFPSVAGLFEARMDHHMCELVDMALLTFQAELGRYDWVPSTALAGSAIGAAGGGGAGGANQAGWLHPQALDLTRHRPLAVFTNDLVQMFNELRQCALYGLRAPVTTRTVECLTGALNLMRAVRAAPNLQQPGPKANEFAKMCQHFAHILVPLISAHLEAVFGASARLDCDAITASMVPDLLPETEAADPALLAEADASAAMEEAAAAQPAPAAEGATTMDTPPAAVPEADLAAAPAEPAPAAEAAGEQLAAAVAAAPAVEVQAPSINSPPAAVPDDLFGTAGSPAAAQPAPVAGYPPAATG
eukprot:TRINITY_DN123320_c0_g1_i1.p1 TRINITY_DN123320_c0_g1~~TRINITY_DN123320_c0_g1_i1.p1  ORF type:complete len:683 (+),score=182.74 TRINITY_DN123320_c0_g1_i1:84-2132(+)